VQSRPADAVSPLGLVSMMESGPSPARLRHAADRLRLRAGRALVVMTGILVGQAILYGPSLIGHKILLPLDILAQPGVYLPETPDVRPPAPHDSNLSDLVYQFEPERRFGAAEVHAGRWPWWTPYQFAGSPTVLPKFSPFWILKFCFLSPVIVAWAQVAVALVAGSGAYRFCRDGLRVGYWPAAVAAWCYPLTGFFVFWQGTPVAEPVAWFPWILVAVDRCVRKPDGLRVALLAAVSGLILVSGHLDVAGQLLLGSGIYASWCFVDEYRKQWLTVRTFHAAAAVTAAWALGFLLASPHWLPLLEYAHTGDRMALRSQGEEERPPVGLKAMPRAVLPYIDGTTQLSGVMIGEGILPESAATAYTGLLATLLIAPLAWCSRRHRSVCVFFTLFAVFGLGWQLDMPGVVQLLRLPLLRMMSHNRLVCLTSFAILAMASIGLDALFCGAVVRRWWFWLPTASLASLCGWCVFRAVFLPEPLATEIESALWRGSRYAWIVDIDGLRQSQGWFVRIYAVAAILSGMGVLASLLLWFRPNIQRRLAAVLGTLLVVDLLWFAHGVSAQCDPALYYPRIPVLEKIAAADDGRIVGMGCLPAALSQTHNLRDIRGEDGVDPMRLMQLMEIVTPPGSPKLNYASTQWFRPLVNVMLSGEFRLAPVLDMLAVKYIVFRGSPPPSIHPALVGEDYWVLINSRAMPRVYVPRQVETIADYQQRLAKLAAPQFRPDRLAYVETPVDLPNPCDGSARIVDEVPTRITVSVAMKTRGLVVLADLWDAGWKAYLNGEAVPIVRTNHALRGVVVPPGRATLEFRYEPDSVRRGLWLASLALAVLTVWIYTSHKATA
jgi:hypothetical protein